MPYKPFFFTALVLGFTGFAHAQDATTLEWTDLIPEEDLRLLEAMPTIDHEQLSEDELAEDQPVKGLRPAEDALADSTQNAIAQAMDGQEKGERTWEDALVSRGVRPEFNNSRIRLPGFVVPLEFDDDMNISEFFLVPYFGACIHVPPPPPNQIIFVSYPQGLQLDALYTPFWVTGTLKIETVENDTALAVYSMDADTVIEYEESP